MLKKGLGRAVPEDPLVCGGGGSPEGAVDASGRSGGGGSGNVSGGGVEAGCGVIVPALELDAP